MKKAVSAGMIVVGVGLLVLGFSDYTPAACAFFGSARSPATVLQA